MANNRRRQSITTKEFADQLRSIRELLPAETPAEKARRIAAEAKREAAKLGFRSVSRSTRYVEDSLSQAARDLANSER